MSERVEEIRRRFEDDPSSDNVFDASDIAILLTALAQAERERDDYHALYMEYVERKQGLECQLDAARAEVERLKNSVVIPASAEQLNNQRDQIQELTQRATDAEARTRALEAALTPFAKRAEYFDRRMKADGAPWADDDVYADDPPSDIYLGHLRAARAALTERTQALRRAPADDAGQEREARGTH